MSDDRDEGLSATESMLLRSLAQGLQPSPGLEDRVVSELKRRGLVRAHGGTIMKTVRIAGVAAGLGIVFVAGLATGRHAGSPPTTHAPVGNQYMLLMFTREASGRAQRGEPARRAIVREYGDWARARQAEGRLVGADKLSDVTRVMTQRDGVTAVAEAVGKDRHLGGYFTITARDVDEAITIARTHPHLKYGGEVEVRPIEGVR